MASPRYLFGSGASDFAIAPPSRHGGFVVSAASLGNGTLWSASTGGVQYTDLQTVNGGATSKVSTDKDGGIVPFYGPLGVDGAWLDFGGGTRAFLAASQGQDGHVAALVADDISAVAVALDSRILPKAQAQGDARYPQRTERDAAAARNPDALIAGTVTRDGNGAATSAPVAWPDGTPGTYTALVVSTSFPGAVDSYRVTYGSPVTRTYTQPTITRDANGAVVNVPAITVS